MINRYSLLFLLCLLNLTVLSGQSDFWKNYAFTKADSLRGSLRPERICYDVTYYELDIRVDIPHRSLEGFVDIHSPALTDFDRLQIDLFDNMKISRIVYVGEELAFKREQNAIFIKFPQQKKGTKSVFRVYYSGKPKVAAKPPWDGGFIWTTDESGKPWVTVACQGIGASLWWPNKDHLSDEPDSLSIRVTLPNGLRAIANGQLRSISLRKDEYCYEWFVSYPINNYNVSINIGDYVHISDQYESEKGAPIALDYYVLKRNEEVATQHFTQVKDVLACLEQYLGPYPFPDDGFALIETPYNGMEHQSGIAYGNRFQKGYLGLERIEGIDFDYVIMHEAAHEYFGNSLSCTDIAEIWLHESFTTYMESVYVECKYGYDNALRYLLSQRQVIENLKPIVGPADINWNDWDSSDNYNKGAWVLHTLRNVLQDDGKWFELLRGFYEKYKYGSVTTDEWIQYVNNFTGEDFGPFFQQYLYHAKLPRLEYRLQSSSDGVHIRYRWRADVPDFKMPILAWSGEKSIKLEPTIEWQKSTLGGFSTKDFRLAGELFLIEE